MRTIEKMSLEDLYEARDKIEREIENKRQQRAVEVRAKAAELAEKAGFNLEDLIGRPRRKRNIQRGKRGATGKIYHNPDNPQQTWNGWGRRPEWFVRHQMSK